MIYDTHAHLDFPDFATDLDLLMERARTAGVSRIITIGTDLESSERALKLSERFPEVFAVIGWHPNEAHLAPEDLSSKLLALAEHPKVVAIGETGLDYYRLPGAADGSTAAGSSTRVDHEEIKQRQAKVFRQHLEVASQRGLNCVIHQRAAFADTLAVMREYAGRVRGQFHCFSEGVEALQQVLELGSLVSFTGILTFKSAQTVRASLQAVPAGKFMLETDCPYLAPVPYRGKRCEPAHVMETARLAAELRGYSLQELGEQTRRTAHEFFSVLK